MKSASFSSKASRASELPPGLPCVQLIWKAERPLAGCPLCAVRRCSRTKPCLPSCNGVRNFHCNGFRLAPQVEFCPDLPKKQLGTKFSASIRITWMIDKKNSACAHTHAPRRSVKVWIWCSGRDRSVPVRINGRRPRYFALLDSHPDADRFSTEFYDTSRT